MSSQQTRRRRSVSLATQVPALESRTLLSGVTSAIQIDQQAPEVLVDTEAFQLLSLTDEDSTRIFQSDGTQAGTVELADVPGTVLKTDIFGEVNGRLIFRASEAGQVWSTDGTPGETQSIANLSFDDAYAESGLFQDRLYFAGDGGNGVELWSTDGTTAGTREVADINSGEATPEGVSFAFDPIPEAVSYDLRLFAYRGAADGVLYPSDELLASANDVADTTVTLQPTEPLTPLTLIIVTPNFSDGSQGAEVWQDLRVPQPVDNVSSHPNQFTVFNEELWFAAETPGFGREWWKTDGTAAGTQLAVDVLAGPAGSYPVHPLEFDQQLFFGAYGDQDLYRTDGTSVVQVSRGSGVNHANYIIRHTPLRSQPLLQAPSFPIAILNHRLIVQQGTGGGESGTRRRLVSMESSSSALHDLDISVQPVRNSSEGSSGHFFQGFTEVNDRLVFRRTRYTNGRDPTWPTSTLLSTDGVTTDVLYGTIGANEGSNQPKLVDTMGPVSGNVLRMSVGVQGSPLIFSKPAAILTDGTVEGTQVITNVEELPAPFGFLGERTFDLRVRRDASNQPHVDLYQIDADGQSFLLMENVFGEFVNFGGQLFLNRQVDGGRELALIEPRSFEPLSVTDGAGQTTDATPTLHWADSGSDVVRYDLFINRVGDRSAAVYRRSDLISTSHTVETVLPEGNYEAWLRAHYADGTKTRWGTQPVALTIGGQTGGPTNAPVSVTGGTGTQTTVTPTLTWDEPGFDVDRYDLYINPVGARSTASYRRSSLVDTSHTLETSLADGEYEVWLRVYFSDGTISRWGTDPASLTVNAGQTSDGPPQILTPGAVATSVRPQFTWTATTGALSYEIWVSNATTWKTTSLIREKDLPGPSFTPTADLAGGRYRVWVRAKLVTGNTSWSAASHFVAGNERPILNVSDGVASWPAVSRAARYELWVDQLDENGKQIAQQIYHNTQLTSLEIDLKSELSAGNHAMWLRIVYDGETVTRSLWSIRTKFTLS